MDFNSNNSEPEAPEPNIHDVLGEETEIKTPGASNPADAWNFDQEPAQNEPEGEQTSEPEEQKTTRAQDLKAKVTAQTAVALIDSILTGGGSFIVQKQFESKFTPEEMQLINDHNLEDKAEDQVEAELQATFRKFTRLSKRLTKKANAMPLDKDERESTYNAWYQYAKITNLDLSPAMLLIGNTGALLATRIAVILEK